MAERNCLDTIRAAIETLDDEHIQLIIENIVGGFIHGMIDDLHARRDDIVAGVVEGLVGHISAAAQQAQLRDVTLAASKIGAPSPNIAAAIAEVKAAQKPSRAGTAASKAQDAVKHICEVCGRDGTRRYTRTPTGWRCAPSSADRCARRSAAQAGAPPVDPRFTHRSGRGVPQAHETHSPAVAAASTAPAPARGDFAAPVTQRRVEKPAQAFVIPHATDGVITAQCQDCRRTWTLSGPELQADVDGHELRKGHIVDVLDRAEEGAA